MPVRELTYTSLNGRVKRITLGGYRRRTGQRKMDPLRRCDARYQRRDFQEFLHLQRKRIRGNLAYWEMKREAATDGMTHEQMLQECEVENKR